MKSCKKGYYYCNTEQKCKPIPDGFTVKDDGFLVKEDKQIKKIVKQLRKSVKSHAKQADTLEKKISESKKDHEPEMIRNQLKTAGRASKRIEKHSRKKDNFKAWVQSKITKASDYLDTAADYLDSKEVDEAANPAQQAAIAIDMKKKGKKPKNMSEEGLRAWFGKSSGTTKSGRKVKGWVQVGGKYDGKPCARQPGQTSTPKCVSSAKRRSMSDKERDSAARRKRAADPNQPQKSGAAAPTMVSTDPKKKMKESYGGKGVSRKARLQSIHPPTAQAAIKNIPSETDRGSGNKAKRRAGLPVEKKSPTYKSYVMNKEEYKTLDLRLEVPKNQSDFKKGLMFRESLETNGGMLFVFDRVAQQSFHMTETTIPLDIAFVKEDGIIESIKPLEPRDNNPVYSDGAIELAIEVNRGWFAENNIEVGDELVVEYIVEDPKEKYRSETGTIYDILSEVKDKKGKGSGKKDACYHKVKSRYSVWPSAYASGALVKCRKVGAANWGNKSEGLEIANSKGQIIADVTDIIGPNNLQPITNENGVWKGTQQVTEKHDIPKNVKKIAKELDKAVALHASQAKRLRAAGVSEAKVDDKFAFGTTQARNKRMLGKKGSTEPQGYFGQKPSEAAQLAAQRRKDHEAKRGVKTKGISEENLDELSKGTLGNYVRKATSDLRGQSTVQGAETYAGKSFDIKGKYKPGKIADKRQKGIGKAIDRLAKEEVELDEKCWKGYEKKGMKTMFGKRYPNCVKKKARSESYDWREEVLNDLEKIEEGKIGAAIGGGSGAAIGGTAGAAAGRAAGGAIGGAIGKASGIPLGGTVGKALGSTAGHVAGSIAGRATGGGAGAAAGKATQQKLQGKKVKGLKKAAKGGAIGGVIGGAIGGGAGAALRAHNELEGEQLNEYSGVAKQVIRQGIKVGGKTGGRAAQGALGGALKGGRNALKKSGRGEKIGRIAGGAIGGVAGGAAGAPLGGLGSVATGAAGAEVGERIGARVGKHFDNKKKKELPTTKEDYSDWRSELNEDDMKGMSVKSGHKRPTKSGAGMTQKGVEAYRRRNPGSKLKTAVTTKPSKLKKGSKAANRRKSYCARSAGQMKKFPKAAKDPNSRLRQARRRWNC